MSLLNRLPKEFWPEFFRGDCDWGSDRVMTELEQAGCGYLFKIKKSPSVKRAIEYAHCSAGWTSYDNHWEGKESELKLNSWATARCIIIVRRRLRKTNMPLLLGKENDNRQQALAFIENPENIKDFEYSVLVTSLNNDLVSIVDHYRDRVDCENNFDEIKNQWGWGGYTTKDVKRCRFISRMVALINNWWTLYVRLSNPNYHRESITSRPLLMSAIGKLTKSGGQQKISITSQHSLVQKTQEMQTNLCDFFDSIKAIAPQLTFGVEF